jgi:putative transposase
MHNACSAISRGGSSISIPAAAASLRDGLEETLTVMRQGLPEDLERVLSSTNLIQNLFSRVREIGRRVKRWQRAP